MVNFDKNSFHCHKFNLIIIVYCKLLKQMVITMNIDSIIKWQTFGARIIDN